MSFKIVPFGKYTNLPAIVKLLETFLEAFLWKPFQFFRRIPNDVSSITKALSLSMPISIEGTGKNQVQPDQEIKGGMLQ
jgi:hypothetical protein